MISLFINRIFRSIKIDPEVFNEIKKDKRATLSAAIVVILSSTAAGIGATALGVNNLILAPIYSLISWFIWAYIVYFVGVKLFPDLKTKTTQFALLREERFSLNGPEGIVKPFPIHCLLLKQTIDKFLYIEKS